MKSDDRCEGLLRCARKDGATVVARKRSDEAIPWHNRRAGFNSW